MPKFANLLAVLALISGSLSAEDKPRYFKEDSLTGAMYIALAQDGSYSVTAREHMFVAVVESGRWSKTDSRIKFIPKKSRVGSTLTSYDAQEVSYKGTVFLALESDAGPSIVVSIAEIKQRLDQNPKELPPYVFFEISGAVYQQEIKQTYPFRTRPNRIPPFELRGNLAKIFSISDCQYISGLTCKIRYNGAAPLPSEVFFEEFDEHGRKAGARVRLIYPKLERGERGSATFRIRLASPAKIVLQGEWNGPWRDPY